ncbi:MAG: hypothetical protein SO412_07615 [Erysipelotrichaceae bacterium]|nr:hypothetical protein [Erysipelotrichaceae bacterium]
MIEVLEKREDEKSIIFGLQVSPKYWHIRLGSGTVANAIPDKSSILHMKYCFRKSWQDRNTQELDND